MVEVAGWAGHLLPPARRFFDRQEGTARRVVGNRAFAAAAVQKARSLWVGFVRVKMPEALAAVCASGTCTAQFCEILSYLLVAGILSQPNPSPSWGPFPANAGSKV
jgi:hypothetical protein